MTTQQPDPLAGLLVDFAGEFQEPYRYMTNDKTPRLQLIGARKKVIAEYKAKINALMIPREEVEAVLNSKTMKLEKDESNSDWFFGYGYNKAISDIRSALGMDK